MAGFLGEDQVRRVKEAIDLADLVGSYATIRRAGHDFKACCPIHQERTPSMHIYVDQQTYHCFGCGAHGDAISLVRTLENLEFVEAMEFLARRAGIQLQYERGSGDGGLQRSQRDRYLQIMEWATGFYERCLWEDDDAAEARAYLADRALSEAVCREFRLGWAPGRGRLVAAAGREGIARDDLLALDLAMEREGRGVSDRFFERLIFPICDRFGHPIAYSGRLLPAAQRRAEEEGRGVGKYINSRDTPLYHKGDVVFNLHRARKAARTAKRLLVMEGPTDVMAADQADLGECVAVLGTALTGEHARQLGSMVGEEGHLILLFDGDEAGQANSIKAIKTCLAAGVPTRAAVLPGGQDPAELLAGDDGKEVFDEALGRARTDIDQLLHALAPRPHELDQRGLIRAVDSALEPLRGMKDPELLRLYAETVASYMGLDRERIWRRLCETPATPARRRQQEPTDEEELSFFGLEAGVAPVPDLLGEQETVLHILVRYPDLRETALDDLGCEPCFFPEPWRDLMAALLEDIDADAERLTRLPVVQDHPPVHASFYRWRQRPLPQAVDGEEALRRVLIEAVRGLRVRAVESRLRRAEHRLKEAQRSGDSSAARDCFKEVVELQRMRREVAAGASER